MTRLEAIFDLIQKCDCFADIGCDHGFISEFVLKNQLASRVITTDISSKCLQKAQKLLSNYQNVEFLCTDGLNGVAADQVVIAGMGGHTIMDILLGRLDGTVYILQPQDHAYEVRYFLTEQGYRITDDLVAYENDKFYDIIRAEKGEQRLDEFEAELGVFYQNRDDLLIKKLQRLYKKYSSYNDGGKNDEIRAFLKSALRAVGAKMEGFDA